MYCNLHNVLHIGPCHTSNERLVGTLTNDIWIILNKVSPFSIRARSTKHVAIFTPGWVRSRSYLEEFVHEYLLLLRAHQTNSHS